MRSARVSALVLCLVLVSGCSSARSGAKASDLRRQVLQTQAVLATDGYARALEGARSTAAAVHAFLDQPSPGSLAAARNAWVAARPAYERTEAWRFSDGPIDTGESPEAFINAAPLDAGYLDQYISGSDPVTPEALHAANAKGGVRNISTGWHAIEYLLWGKEENPRFPGNRPPTDYGLDDPSTARRRDYLGVVADLLVADLGKVAAQWDPQDGVYRRDFVSLAPAEGLRRILTGLGALSGGELAGRRISMPYESKDQTNELSAFSDNTVADLLNEQDGIFRTYIATETTSRKAGPSLSDLVKAVDPKLDFEMHKLIDATGIALARVPRLFDQAILGDDSSPGRLAIKTAITALDAQTKGFVRVAQALEVRIKPQVP